MTTGSGEPDLPERVAAPPRPGERTERLLGLLFLLMASRHPVTKATIRQALPDYAASPSEGAFERMFERDKEELRSMGIPIQTVEGTQGAGGIDGYRVLDQEYALPEVSFTSAELTVLGLAAQVWEQASLGPAARNALRKLEAAGGTAREDSVGVIARLTTPEPSFGAFLAASQARRPVRFDYRRPDEAVPTQRHLEPWGVVSRRRHWYVVGRDRDRQAVRVFRLSRVSGKVMPDGPEGSYQTPDAPDLGALVAQADSDSQHRARIRVRSGEAASLRRAAAAVRPDDPGWDLLELDYGDDESFADRLVGHGPAVQVLAPQALQAAVVRRLRAALAAARGAS